VRRVWVVGAVLVVGAAAAVAVVLLARSPSPRELYGSLLTSPFDQPLPPGFAATGVSRFLYADAGPPGLVGAAEVSLRTPPQIRASLTFDVFAGEGAARAYYDERARNLRLHGPATATEVIPLDDLGHPGECAVDQIEGAVCVVAVGDVLVWARAARESAVGLEGMTDQAAALATAGVDHVESVA